MPAIETIVDYLAISTLKARYCRMIDTKDWIGYGALVTDDFVMDVSDGTDVPPIHGRDAAIAMIRASIETAKTAHQVHTPEIQIDGDEASAIWAMQDRLSWGADRPSFTGYGHYHERYVRQDDGWKIAALRLTRLHLDFDPPRIG